MNTVPGYVWLDLGDVRLVDWRGLMGPSYDTCGQMYLVVVWKYWPVNGSYPSDFTSKSWPFQMACEDGSVQHITAYYIRNNQSMFL